MPQESPFPCALPGWRATSRLGCQPGVLLHKGESGGERNPGELQNLPAALLPGGLGARGWASSQRRRGRELCYPEEPQAQHQQKGYGGDLCSLHALEYLK